MTNFLDGNKAGERVTNERVNESTKWPHSLKQSSVEKKVTDCKKDETILAAPSPGEKYLQTLRGTLEKEGASNNKFH